MFLQERSYGYFLELGWQHIGPIAEMGAYDVLRNHFYVAVYIKARTDLTGPQ
jgi:hypothetical protein